MMAIDEAKFRDLMERAEHARAERDRAAGQLEAAMDRLKTEFGCGTVAAAERELASIEKAAAKAEAVFDKAVKQFEEDWDDRQDGEDT